MLQVRTAERNEVMQRAARARPVARTATSSARPSTTRGKASRGLARRQGRVQRQRCATCTRPGTSVSWQHLRSLRDNPACADSEHARCWTSRRPRPARPTLDASTRARTSPRRSSQPGARPSVAILREQGVNSHVEMAYALHRGRLRGRRRAHDATCRPAARRWTTSRASSPAAASATATRWAPAMAGRAASSCSTRCWREQFAAFFGRAATPSRWACATAAR